MAESLTTSIRLEGAALKALEIIARAYGLPDQGAIIGAIRIALVNEAERLSPGLVIGAAAKEEAPNG